MKKINPKPPLESARYVGSLPRNRELYMATESNNRPVGLLPTGHQRATKRCVTMEKPASMLSLAIYQDLVDRRLRLPRPVLRTLGNSDEYATHCLLMDLHSRHIFVAPKASAERFLHRQHGFDKLNPADWTPKHDLPDILTEAVMEAIREALDQEMERRAQMATAICRRCLHGYLLAADWGYEKCPQCHGENVRLVPPDEAEVLGTEWDIIYPATYSLEGKEKD